LLGVDEHMLGVEVKNLPWELVQGMGKVQDPNLPNNAM